MIGVHNRMPLILRREDMDAWLFSEAEAKELLGMHFDELQRERSDGEEYRQMRLF